MAEREWKDNIEEMGELLEDLGILLELVHSFDPEHAERIAGMILDDMEDKFRELTGHEWPWESETRRSNV